VWGTQRQKLKKDETGKGGGYRKGIRVPHGTCHGRATKRRRARKKKMRRKKRVGVRKCVPQKGE